MILRCTVTKEHIAVYYADEKSRRVSVAEANHFHNRDLWLICRVMVQPGLRGKGLGSRLLKRLIKEIKKKGAKAILVAPGGYNANYNKQTNFYMKNGFKPYEPEGLYRLELGGDEDAVVQNGQDEGHVHSHVGRGNGAGAHEGPGDGAGRVRARCESDRVGPGDLPVP